MKYLSMSIVTGLGMAGNIICLELGHGKTAGALLAIAILAGITTIWGEKKSA